MYMSHACLKELACLVESHCLFEITKFESYNFVIIEFKQQFGDNTHTQTKYCTVPSAHVGEGN